MNGWDYKYKQRWIIIILYIPGAREIRRKITQNDDISEGAPIWSLSNSAAQISQASFPGVPRSKLYSMAMESSELSGSIVCK